MTPWGLTWVSAKETSLPASCSLSSTNVVPVRLDNVSQPSVEMRPLVVPDSVKIASAARMSVSISGRPAATPSEETPWLRARRSTSGPGLSMMPLQGSPSFSARGPRASNLARIWV